MSHPLTFFPKNNFMLNKFIKLFLLNNEKTKKPSYVITMVVFGFFIINLKLLLSGISITDKFKMSEFSGVDYSAALSALGGLHLFNKKITHDSNPENNKDTP